MELTTVLGASVFGPDQEDCIKVAKQLQCGMVSVNDFAVYYVSSFVLLRVNIKLQFPNFRSIKTFLLVEQRAAVMEDLVRF
jgi:hypothetical protein